MNQTALITGASKGIGKALAEKLLTHGYKVIGSSRNGSIDINHENFKPLKLDVSEPSSIDAALQEIKKTFPKIDLLINNAGIGPDLRMEAPERKSFESTFKVNVEGLVFFTEDLLPHINEQGSIINISSKMGSLDSCQSAGSIAYRMSKSALNMYTKTLAIRLKDKIKVAALHPGWVKTTIIESNLTEASLTPEASAEGIYEFLMSDFKTAAFWDVEAKEDLGW